MEAYFSFVFFGQTLDILGPYIEHCKDCAAAFLRAFFDGEGSMERRSLRVHNTDEKLLVYVQGLLRQFFGIEATGPHKGEKAGHRFRDSRTGRVYFTKRQCYYLYIPVQELLEFHRCIGFTIERKRWRLIEAVRA